jgi:hypothetical protein
MNSTRNSTKSDHKVASSDELFRTLDGVNDETSFLRFLEALSADRSESVRQEAENPSPPWGPEANGWENPTIEAFLLASVAWAVDARRAPALKNPENPWRRCAEILYAGKGYE